jgi:hypothetical protein
MKNLVLSIALTSITFIALFAPPVKAILPDSSDYKQAKKLTLITILLILVSRTEKNYSDALKQSHVVWIE